MAGRGLNKVMIIGNLGKDPQMRYTPSGSPVTNFTVAVNRVLRTPEGDSREETEWFNIVAWARLAETCNEYLRKGARVYIEGRLQTRHWEDQQGQKRTTMEIVANEMLMLDARGATEAQGAGEGQDAGARLERADDDQEEVDDLPF